MTTVGRHRGDNAVKTGAAEQTASRTIHRRSRLEPNVEIQLPHEPTILRLPILSRIHKLNLEPAQKTRHQFIHLQRANVPSDTRPRPGPKLKHGRLHLPQLGRLRFEPALRAVRVRVGAEDFRAPVQHPRVAADDCAAGDALAADCGARGGDVAFEEEADGGEDAPGFLDAGVEVGELLRGGPGDDAGGVRGDCAVGPGGIEFGG